MTKSKKKRKWAQTMGASTMVPCPAHSCEDCEGTVELCVPFNIGSKRLLQVFEDGFITLNEKQIVDAGLCPELYREELDAKGEALVSAGDLGLELVPCDVCAWVSEC